MCFPFDAIVPELPERFQVIAGGAAGERLTLTSADGTEFSAYLAQADGPTGVVVLPDVRGLFRFYEQLAERFAAAGHPAIAIDYFGRTAGLDPRDEDFEWMPHVKQTTPENIALDVAAALQALGTERAITVGFCFGGAQSFMSATMGHAGLAGVVGFYGSLVSRPGGLQPDGTRWSIDRAPEAKVPVLGLFGGADENITPDQIAAFDAALPVEHEIHVYEGAPHSFFDRRQESYKDESQDAWERILGFITALEVPA
ncbi:dienelactone hydrolase family protein [Solirubrobacter ginsenosidimutans]|uniref:Dienelactone hydrolase family protein n=1 Tax=Solirubrobacter ginsenosidimutans TaxID=490573 RepID=A0A9X3N2D8_9ACTN|nr:dienelactone hydrolase family protein [Solirubrobacter ginsenosidimutans]MDA0165798.1 dienelactone hydrolase family protein [Solirubrobacter ginsenosidimutans]